MPEAFQLRDRKDLVQADVGLQSPGPVEGEPETVQDSPSVAELREELDGEVAGDRWSRRVVVRETVNHPVGRKFHGC